MSEQVVESKQQFVKAAMMLTGLSLAVIIWQGMSGIGQLGYTFSGWMLADLHARSGEFGLLLALIAAILLKLSKQDDKALNGMSIGYFTMWLLQIGLAHAYAGPHWLGMVHVMLAFLMFGHGLFMMPRLKAACADAGQ